MPHSNMLDPARTTLVITDMQDAFRSHISDFTETAARIALMAHAAQLLGMPIIVTEQYPKGLGHTADEIRAVLPSSLEAIEKMSFSSCGAPQFIKQLEDTGATQVLLCGIEAHICVNQTAHDLLARQFQVHLLTDCITARDDENKALALAKLRHSGALPSTIEMALFEFMRDAHHKHFKTIQKLIK
ncbi:MAG: hydrolase [Pyrinomonadaceae bacterium]|nr:hydrolase [Pyrinomonadaceae bacterium]